MKSSLIMSARRCKLGGSMDMTDKEVAEIEKISLRRITKKIANKSLTEDLILFKMNLCLLKMIPESFFDTLNNPVMADHHYRLVIQIERIVADKSILERDNWLDYHMELWGYFIHNIPERPTLLSLDNVIESVKEIREYELNNNMYLFYSYVSLPKPDKDVLFVMIYRFCRMMAWIDTIKEGRQEHDMLFLFYKKKVNIELTKFFKSL